MQLDAGMPKPAFPPFSTGNIPFCSVIITILNLMPGHASCLTQKEPVAGRVIYSSFSHFPLR